MTLLRRIPRWVPVVLALLLALLYFKRLGAGSLWLDEAWEANYYAGYTPAPWYNRPVLYMGLVRLLVSIFGPWELVFRFAPCLAAIGAIVATYRIARRFMPRFEGLVAAACVAFAMPFVTFSHQLKNYTFDALFSALLVTAWLRYRDDRSPRRLALYAVTAAVSFGFSFSSVFVIAAIGAVEAFSPGRWRFLAANAAVAVVFAVSYFAFYAGGAADPLLRDYFVDAYLPWKTPGKVPAWVVHETKRIAVDQSGSSSGIATLLVMAAGVFATRAARPFLLVFAGTAAINLTASALALYPFGVPRLSIYLAPFVAVTVALGISRARDWPRHRAIAGGVAVLVAGFLAGPAVALGLDHLWNGRPREEIRDMVARIAAARVPGEAIYVNEDADPAFNFYWCREGKAYPPEAFVLGGRFRKEPERHAGKIESMAAAHEAVWTLVTHAPFHEVDAIMRLMEARYERVESLVIFDARMDRWKRKS